MKRKILFIICAILAFIVAVDAAVVGILIRKSKEKYQLGYLVDSIKGDIIVERLSDDKTTKEILASEEKMYIICYRPDNGVKEFPAYIDTSKKGSIKKIDVDVYGSFLIYYSDYEQYVADMDALRSDSNTAFAEEVEYNEMYSSDFDIKTNVVAGEMSYIPRLMNSREYARAVAGSKRKLKVVVMDTGMYSKESVVAPYINDTDGITYDYFNGDDSVFDGIDRHATMVGSVILDVIGDAAGNISLYNAKVLENGVGSSYDVYTALMSLTDKNVDIINMSFGGAQKNEMLAYALSEITKKGTVVVASSGNDSATEVSYPAAYDNVIAVSAIDEDKNIAYFSNTGSKVEFTAPGVDIVVNSVENQTAIASGTSFSSPAIAGYAALNMLEDANVDSYDTVVKKMKSKCEDLGESGRDNLYGYGMPVYYPDIPEPTQPSSEETTPEPTKTPEVTKPEPTTKTPQPTKPQPSGPQPTKPQPTMGKPESTTPEPTTKAPEVSKPEKPKPPVTELGKVESLYNSSISYKNGEPEYAVYQFKSVENAQMYEVYYAVYNGETDFENLGWKLLGTTASTCYYDYNVYEGMDILIKVRAVNGNIKGDFSEECEVDLLDDSVDLRVTSKSAGEIILSWDSMVRATGYEIYVKDSNGNYAYSNIVSADTTSYRINGLDTGKSYTVHVFNRFNRVSYGEIGGYHGGTNTSAVITVK